MGRKARSAAVNTFMAGLAHRAERRPRKSEAGVRATRPAPTAHVPSPLKPDGTCRRRRSSVAEHLSGNEKVAGSAPADGSISMFCRIFLRKTGVHPRSSRGQAFSGKCSSAPIAQPAGGISLRTRTVRVRITLGAPSASCSRRQAAEGTSLTPRHSGVRILAGVPIACNRQCACSSAEERSPDMREVPGSFPGGRTNTRIITCPVAQRQSTRLITTRPRIVPVRDNQIEEKQR